MKVTDKFRRNLRLQNTAFVGLFLAVIGLAAWLTNTYSFDMDWTAGNRNSISQASRKLLSETDSPITITAYASKKQGLRKQIRRFVGKYRRAGVAEIHLEFVNPNAQPQRVRKLGIQRDGQLVVAYKGRTETVDRRSEQAVTNAIQRVMRSEQRHVRFLAGHGERSPTGRGRDSLSQFVKALKSTGAKVATLNLGETPKIPKDTSLLVIASPTRPLLKPEVKKLQNYVKSGGNLLWMADGGPSASLRPLAKELGVHFLKGKVVDPQARMFGLQDPTRVLVTSYPRQAITRHFRSITLFPGTTGLQEKAPKGWKAKPIIRTGRQAWLETGPIKGEVRFQKDQGDKRGPLSLAVALSKTAGSSGKKADPKGGESARSGKKKSAQQRVVVTADSDFLANAFLGSAGNRDLGLNMVHWLTSDEDFINVQPHKAPGTSLELSPSLAWALPVLFLIGIPVFLLGMGATVWMRRRKL
ncbi:MAG TPA: DUF4350 domain-containing protein [Gammaproteobacteria bacterium]|nr:DUF4350 domain-containing protein [Gammaproteobacteria bacterium]